MNAIRSVLFYVILILSLTFFVLTGIVLYIFLTRDQRIHHITHFNRFTTHVLAPKILGLSFRVHGLGHIPKHTAVYLIKHQSAWETIATPAFLPLHTWVLKRELIWLPIFGIGLKMTAPIEVNRAKPRQALKELAQQGKERLQSGVSLVIFPEGTRMPVGQMGDFKVGGAWLAKQCGVPVVPIAHNAGLFWPKNSFIKKPGEILVVIGEPINTEQLSAEEINARVSHWMSQQMALLEKGVGKVDRV